jgi:TonB family protein
MKIKWIIQTIILTVSQLTVVAFAAGDNSPLSVSVTPKDLPPKVRITLARYESKVVMMLQQRWHPRCNEKSAHVSFHVAADGTVSRVRLIKSSGKYITDQTALSAVESLNKLPPLPSGVESIVASIEFDPTKLIQIRSRHRTLQ